ncbi:hypothetical protein [Crossiella sp. NPDC003009]
MIAYGTNLRKALSRYGPDRFPEITAAAQHLPGTPYPATAG